VAKLRGFGNGRENHLELAAETDDFMGLKADAAHPACCQNRDRRPGRLF